jgi:hypothetical protein
LFSFFIFLAILDFLPILRIPSDSEHHNHRFNAAWGDSFLTTELLSPSELLKTHRPTNTVIATKTAVKLHAALLKLSRNIRSRL